MIITALTENTALCAPFGAEHGLSLYIETNRRRILFDTGQSDLFAQNASLLGVNLAEVDLAVLSHGHYDHGGGLKRFLTLNDMAPVYLSRYAFEPHFNAQGKDIGLDLSLQGNDRLITVGDKLTIGDGLTLCSCNDQERYFPTPASGLTVMQDGRLVDEDFRHEQYLLVEEGGRRIVISGCSHKGVLNIISWLRPDVLIGGFHFMKLPADDALRRAGELLDSYDTEYYTCHCTGVEQYRYLSRYMSRLHYLHAGQSITI